MYDAHSTVHKLIKDNGGIILCNFVIDNMTYANEKTVIIAETEIEQQQPIDIVVQCWITINSKLG